MFAKICTNWSLQFIYKLICHFEMFLLKIARWFNVSIIFVFIVTEIEPKWHKLHRNIAKDSS